MKPKTLSRAALLLSLAVFTSSCSTTSQTPANAPMATPTPAAPAPATTTQQATPPVAEQKATIAAPKTGNAAFFEKHEKFLARGKEGRIGVLFIGDSITEQWNKAPEVWDKYFGSYQPANFGIGGDQTQHVLWRIQNGELDGINPKVVVMMIGTNNSAAHSGADIAEANRMIIREIQSRLPRAKVLLLAIFPRDPRPERPNADEWEKRMTAIREANTQLARLDNGRTVRFLDLGPKFMGADGRIPDDVMPDQLHLSPAGYEIWAQNMQPLLREMLAN